MAALSSGLSTGVNIGARRAVSNITPFCIGGAASKGCFTAGTLVETIDGDKPIETIEIGDYVLSADPETEEIGYKEVVNTYIHVKDTLVYVTVNGEVIETTEEHPFWVEGSGWVSAKNLNNGDIVRDKNGNNIVVENVETIKLSENEYVAVYNFEVAEYHTYFVSDFDVLVHNICIDKYDVLKNNKTIPGQAHHLSQNAAFKSIIPKGEGLCVKLPGNILNNKNSPHYKAHKSMETFWDKYRKNGTNYGKIPTVGEYNKALYDSLISAGITKSEAIDAVKVAYKQQVNKKLNNKSQVPRVCFETKGLCAK